ncbi:hypothetical protein BDW22DRAFT_1352866 [Trametopsis cervina]|nr:hypothetical protein BDW22DRAFT_1352866 [Trametopsis cervina]
MLQELPSVAPLYNPIPIKYVLSPTALPEEVRRKGREIQRLSFRRSTKMEKAKTRPSELPERSTGKGKGKMRLSEPPERSPSEKVKKRTGAPVKARKTKKHVRFVEEESSSDESASTVDDLSLNDLLDDDADASPGVWKHQKDNSSGPGFFDVFPILFILPLLILRNL